SRLDAQPGDLPVLRRWHLDDRLLGLDRDERLIGHYMIALADMPRDQLGLLQAFAEIRQHKRAHDRILAPLRPPGGRGRGPRRRRGRVRWVALRSKRSFLPTPPRPSPPPGPERENLGTGLIGTPIRGERRRGCGLRSAGIAV